MKADFEQHNLFWRNFDDFLRIDPHLSKLSNIKHKYISNLAQEIPLSTPGIYILTGGRQVGKSTLIKQMIKRLLQRDVKPANIYYLPCDTIIDFKKLLFEIEDFQASLKKDDYFFLFLDEISYVAEWERAIKSLADMGCFQKGSVLITGSDSYLLKKAMMSFPGRRGNAPHQDFHQYPLSFYEYIGLKNKALLLELSKIVASFDNDPFKPIPVIATQKVDALQNSFNEYLLTGGYLRAINDLASDEVIHDATYKTYTQWVIGDMLKRGKDEDTLLEIILSLAQRMCSQVTWNNLVTDLSIQHHQTIMDYVKLLTQMDVTFILPALREDKLKAAPKKAKKIAFCDPFIFSALHGRISGKSNYFDVAKQLISNKSGLVNNLIEGTVSSLFKRSPKRSWETFYIKASAEVDIALVLGKKFLPIEIKNSTRLSRKELKQILKYKAGYIAYSGNQIGMFDHLQLIPIPLMALIAG